MTSTTFTLFTSAHSAASARAMFNVREIAASIRPRPAIRVVDIRDAVDEAIAERVFVTPTLKVTGPRTLTIVGTLEDRAFIQSILDAADGEPA